MATNKIQELLSKYRNVIYPLVSAMLMALAFPPFSLWPLGLIALVPYLYLLNNVRTLKKAFQVSFLMGMFLIYTGFYWVSDVAVNFGGLPWIVGKIVLFAFSLFGEMQFILFGMIVFLAHKYFKNIKSIFSILLYATIYVGVDYLYPKIFPNSIGHGMYGWFSFAQIAEVTGVPGITFLMVAANVAFTFLFVALKNKTVKAKHWFEVSFILIIMILVSIWGNHRIHSLQTIESNFKKLLKVSMIQANIGDVEKLASESGLKSATDKVLNKYKDMSLKAVSDFHPDLIVWPETAYPLLYTHLQNENANRSGSARDQFILDLVKNMQTPLIFGGYSSDFKKDYNTIFYVTPKGEQKGLYRKNILLAFGEYVPLGPLGPIVQNIIPTIADFGRGLGPMAFEYVNSQNQTFRFSPQICYEGIDTEFTRACSAKEVDFILNVTNDSWFGKSAEPYIHFMITAFRTIELRIPLVRTTNTGFSARIDMTGKITHQSNLFEEANVNVELKLPENNQKLPKTIYFLWGEWFGKMCAIFTAIIASIAIHFARKKNPT